MKNYGKLENNNLIISPETIVFDNGECICNPTIQQLIENGYKNIIEDIKIPLNNDEYYLQSYSETESQIIIHFNVMKIPLENTTIIL